MLYDPRNYLPLLPPQRLRNIGLGRVGRKGGGYSRGIPWDEFIGPYKVTTFVDYTANTDLDVARIAGFLPDDETSERFLAACRGRIPPLGGDWEPKVWPVEHLLKDDDYVGFQAFWENGLDSYDEYETTGYSYQFWYHLEAWWLNAIFYGRIVYGSSNCLFGLQAGLG